MRNPDSDDHQDHGRYWDQKMVESMHFGSIPTALCVIALGLLALAIFFK